MKRAIAAALVLLPGAAFGQSYQTALPLSPAEKVALEARLSTVLDYAGSGEATDIVLPTGRVASVRTYQLVRQEGRTPCRGYRIDLQGSSGRTAVDGFRCRQSAGAWAIAEPEIILSQETAPGRPANDVVIVEESRPLDLRGGLFGNEVTVVVPDETSRRSLQRRLPGEPLYPGDDSGLAAATPPAPPPVPRPAPREDLLAAASARTAPAFDVIEEEPAEVAAPAPASVREDPPVETLVDTPAPEPAVPAPVETTVASAGEATTVIPANTGVARTVGTREETRLPDYATDERVTDALEDLDYLDPAAGGTPDAVAAAVDEFARDEQFALPLSADALVERLAAALDRSETVATCGSAGAPVCVAR